MERMKPGPAAPARKVPQPPRHGRLPPVHPEHTRFYASKKFWLILAVVIVLVIILLVVINYTQMGVTEEELEQARREGFLGALEMEELEEEMVVEEAPEEITEEEQEMRELEEEMTEGFRKLGAGFRITGLEHERAGDHMEITHDLDTLTVDYEDGRYSVSFLENVELRDPAGEKIRWFNDKYSTAMTIEVGAGKYQSVSRTFREPLSMFELSGTYRLKIRATDLTPFVKDERTLTFEIE